MQIICAYSSIKYSVPDQFRGLAPVTGLEVHPVFSLPAPALESLYTAWLNRQLSDEESYLLVLALLHSTGLIEFRCAMTRCNLELTNQIISTQMQALISVCSLLTALPDASRIAPKICISEHNDTLTSLPDWVRLWRECLADFRSGQIESQAHDALMHKEAALAKFINSPQIPEHKYAHVLADWACLAANFPSEYRDYWRECIIRCYDSGSLLSIPEVHLQDIREWCETNIDEYSSGSIFSYRLYSLLSSREAAIDEFQMLDEAPAALAAIASAPAQQPVALDYPNRLAYMRAKGAWLLAQNALTKKLGE